MLNIDRKDFARAVGEMLSAHGRNPTDLIMDSWWNLLKDLPDTNLVLRAVREVTRLRPQLPVPKDVLDWYNDHRAPSEPTIEGYRAGGPGWPLKREVMLARRMREAAILADPLMGQAMLDYLRAHPEPAPAAAGQEGPLAGLVDGIEEGLA